jgi:exonuclease SbcD
MRILHTGDWHLGKTLEGLSRQAEHEAFLDELLEMAAEAELILIAGDLFDVYNPPAEAERLLCEAFSRLADGGRRAVVAIAGNHDSPERVNALRPLAETQGIYILGLPGDVCAPAPAREGRVRLVEAWPGGLELALPSGERAVIAALPYPSEARLRRLLKALEEPDFKSLDYSAKVARAFERACARFRPDAVNLAVSHLYVENCTPSESERELVGGAFRVSPDALPAAAQYVALGHLHQAQSVRGAPCVARYAGAPLTFRMGERTQEKTVTRVTVEPGGAPVVETLPVLAGRPMVVWEVEGGVAQVLAEVEAGAHPGAIIHLRVHTPEPLTLEEIASLRRLDRDFLRIEPVLPDGAAEGAPETGRRELPLDEQFRAFFRH